MACDVGIVLPVYMQKESYLRAAIQSILHQTYPNFLCVIVIDGLLPDIETIVHEEVQNDIRVRILKLRQNGGVAQALNRGFAFLTALPSISYLTWVSSDNVYYPTFLEKLHAGMVEGDESLGLVYSSFRHIDEHSVSIYTPEFNQQFIRYQAKPKAELLDICFIGVSFMYKKMFATLIEGYGLEPVEDYDYWLRLTEACEISFIPEILMDYRVDSDFSVSKHLKTSREQQLRWRYAFQLAKHRARLRRGIPFETTILIPIQDDSEVTLQQVENVYNQYYSNFKVIILDLTTYGSAKDQLQHVSDPRVAFATFPDSNIRNAILWGSQIADTRFLFIYDTTQPLLEFELTYLMDGLRGTEPHILSLYRHADGSVCYQFDEDAADPIPMRLYRMEHLAHVLKMK